MSRCQEETFCISKKYDLSRIIRCSVLRLSKYPLLRYQNTPILSNHPILYLCPSTTYLRLSVAILLSPGSTTPSSFPPKSPTTASPLAHAPFLKNISPTSTPASIISAITTAIATARSTSNESSSAHTLSSAASSSTPTEEHRGMCCCSVSR